MKEWEAQEIFSWYGPFFEFLDKISYANNYE